MVVIQFFWPFYTTAGQSTAATTVVHCSVCNTTAYTLEFLVITCKTIAFKAFYTSYIEKLNKSKSY